MKRVRSEQDEKDEKDQEDEKDERETKRQKEIKEVREKLQHPWLQADVYLRGVRNRSLFFQSADFWFVVDRDTGESHTPTTEDAREFFRGLVCLCGGLDFAPDYSDLMSKVGVPKLEHEEIVSSFGGAHGFVQLFLDDKTWCAVGRTGLRGGDGDVHVVLEQDLIEAFEYVTHAFEVQPGLVVAAYRTTRPGYKLAFVMFDLWTNASSVLWHGDKLYIDEWDFVELIPLKAQGWFVCPDETGLCVREARTGLERGRLKRPDGTEIQPRPNLVFGVSDSLIVVIDECVVGDECYDSFGVSLPDLQFRLDVAAKINAAFDDEKAWLAGSKGRYQATSVHALNGTEFAIEHFGRVNFVTL